MREICRNLRRRGESLNRKAAEMLFIKYLSHSHTAFRWQIAARHANGEGMQPAYGQRRTPVSPVSPVSHQK